LSVPPFCVPTPTDAEVVDTSATDHTFTSSSNVYAIYVGGTGDVAATLRDHPSTTVVFKAVPVGTQLRGRFLKVIKATTTATNLLGLITNKSGQA